MLRPWLVTSLGRKMLLTTDYDLGQGNRAHGVHCFAEGLVLPRSKEAH